MAVISKGQTFATGDQVTALKLNNLADNATFASGAVDNVSTQLSGGAIVVKDGGVTTAKLNDSAVTTAKISDANVTFAKLTDVIDDDTMATASSTTLATSESVKAYVDSATNLINAYPVGSIYMNASNSSNPSTLFGFGTWVTFGAGRVPVGIDATQSEFNTAEETGGAKTHTLTEQEIPSHRHILGRNGSITSTGNQRLVSLSNNGGSVYSEYTGGGQAHNNLQPYIVVYMWKRTA
jgi:microcystin-dependent protein